MVRNCLRTIAPHSCSGCCGPDSIFGIGRYRGRHPRHGRCVSRGDRRSKQWQCTGPLAGGRREINWDGGGAVTAECDRGAALDSLSEYARRDFTTPGTNSPGDADDLAVASADSTQLTLRSSIPCSALKSLFTPFGSNITDADFSQPGSTGGCRMPPPAPSVRSSRTSMSRTRRRSSSSTSTNAAGTIFAPVSPGGLSFAGVVFDAESIARVRLVTGNAVPGSPDEVRPATWFHGRLHLRRARDGPRAGDASPQRVGIGGSLRPGHQASPVATLGITACTNDRADRSPPCRHSRCSPLPAPRPPRSARPCIRRRAAHSDRRTRCRA